MVKKVSHSHDEKPARERTDRYTYANTLSNHDRHTNTLIALPAQTAGGTLADRL